MKKIIKISLIFISFNLFGAMFDYEQWAKDLQTMIALNQKIDNSIAGADKNKNQIRDDVEEYVKRKYQDDSFQKIMFLEAAKKIQQILTLPKNSSVKIHQKLDRELLQIYTCRDYILFKDYNVDVEKEMKNKAEFKAKVLNTPKRLRAYIQHKKLLPSVYTIPSDKELLKQKKACEKLYKKVKNQKEFKHSIISSK